MSILQTFGQTMTRPREFVLDAEARRIVEQHSR
jgi:hypothetical protein